MTPTIYMLYVAGRAFLWHSRESDHGAAKSHALYLMRNSPVEAIGRLFTGPTGMDEMKFVGRITR